MCAGTRILPHMQTTTETSARTHARQPPLDDLARRRRRDERRAVRGPCDTCLTSQCAAPSAVRSGRPCPIRPAALRRTESAFRGLKSALCWSNRCCTASIQVRVVSTKDTASCPCRVSRAHQTNSALSPRYALRVNSA